MGDRYKGRVAIVTGAGRGIGRSVAMLLAEEGASVVVNDLGGGVDGAGDSDAPAAQVVREIEAAGGTAVANFDSVADYDSAGKIVQTAIDNYGRIDVLQHVAGILRDRMIFNMLEEEWDSVLQVHLYGAFNMVRNVVPHLIKQKYGRIVLFSSGSGLGASGQANYATAKEGMVGFSRAISRELAPHGITVNAVYPGGATRMTETIPDSTQQLRQQQRSAAAGPATGGGMATQGAPIQGPPEARAPENNAPKAVYLSSEAAGDITGQVIGTSGWPMTLYSPRHVIRSIHKTGRWTLDELDDLIPISLGANLVNPVPEQAPRQ
ncbi:MAG: SDR family NAD(P)-dependent oxidoreductase [Chloroflexi bacterium]|nr:SDR family NAD(P)-dependent oxidoreductase [Chloroflexota bacterium]MCH8869443.1 SDR family NAD(P)-dependent oxidoreductase [Chloroflexota bacterium]MCH9039138.1 SDR family NAD(P)-dependent oxidoreductase [Chloroflexota bacterium]MCI0771345.1 SDR family NAD(P)-dependent oxidoreductase [Chloroflexota bacterium]MCI0791295.1 SDR family NAD(P)-dependent oxidoreductase [Chloroflexota bacterium]